MTKLLFRKIIENRDTLAITFFLFGAPVIYFLRDGVGLAPNSMIFTVALLFGPLFMALPFRNLKNFYSPNQPLYLISFVFLFMTLFALYFEGKMGRSRWYYELIVTSLIIYMYVHFTLMSKVVLEKYFVEITLILCFIGGLLLVYYVYTNPLYAFGQRATINFNKEGEEFSGNPHIFSKVAFYGIVAGAVLFKYIRNTLFKTFIVFSIAVFFVVLVLTQTMVAYLATAVFMLVFFIYNITFSSILGSVRFLFRKWYFWLGVLFVMYKGISVYQNQKQIFEFAYGYFQDRFSGIMESILGNEENSYATNFEMQGDGSANTRVYMIKYVFESFANNMDKGKYVDILFGNGYKNMYIDIPVLEALDSFGIFGFALYMLLYIYMIYVSFREIRRPTSMFAEFVAYGFIYYMFLNLTGGVITDYSRWGYYALVCRFLTDPVRMTYRPSLSSGKALV